MTILNKSNDSGHYSFYSRHGISKSFQNAFFFKQNKKVLLIVLKNFFSLYPKLFWFSTLIHLFKSDFFQWINSIFLTNLPILLWTFSHDQCFWNICEEVWIQAFLEESLLPKFLHKCLVIWGFKMRLPKLWQN